MYVVVSKSFVIRRQKTIIIHNTCKLLLLLSMVGNREKRKESRKACHNSSTRSQGKKSKSNKLNQYLSNMLYSSMRDGKTLNQLGKISREFYPTALAPGDMLFAFLLKFVVTRNLSFIQFNHAIGLGRRYYVHLEHVLSILVTTLPCFAPIIMASFHCNTGSFIASDVMVLVPPA